MEDKAPGRPGIGRGNYVSQIEKWLDEGVRIDEITATKLREAVGGQYKKALAILDEFKEGYKSKELSDLPEPPEQLNNLLSSAALQIWRVLCEEQRKQIGLVTEEYGRQRSKLEVVSVEQLQLIDDLEQENSALSGDLHDRQSDLVAARDEAGNLRIELAEQAERNRQLAGRLADRDRELAETVQELRDSRAELQEVRRDLERQQGNSQELAASLRDTRAELAQATAEAKRCKAEGVKLSEEVAGLNERLQVLQQERAHQDKALSVEQAERFAADRSVVQLREEFGKCQSESKALADSLSATRADLSARSAELEQVEKARAAADQRADQLQAQLVELAKGAVKK